MIRQIAELLEPRQLRQVFLIIAGVCIAAGLEMLSIGTIPAFVSALADPELLVRILPHGDFSEWVAEADRRVVALYGAALLAALFLLKNSFIAALIYAEGSLIRDVTSATATRMFRAYLYKPYTFHLQRNPAELMRNVSTEAINAAGLISSAILLMREGLVLVVVFALLLLLDPVVSLFTFLILGAASTIYFFSVRRPLIQRGSLAQAHRARILLAAKQGLGAIKDAKILARESYLIDTFSREVKGIQKHGLYQRIVTALPRLFFEVLTVTAVVIVAAVFVLLDRPIERMLPVLAMLAVGAVRLVPAFNSIATSLARIQYQRPALDLVRTELQLAGKRTDSKQMSCGGGSFVFHREIRFNDVCYQYPDAREPVLLGISLAIKAGESVGFTGPSGAGKSTLIDLIIGLLSPTSGKIYIDGNDVERVRSSWQRQVGYVSQNVYLIDDSIRRNVAFGVPDEEIDDKALMRALRASQLHAFVEHLDAGVETTVGDRGIRLSGGQQQRLGIARALYHNPRVLVFDEATSAVDSETETELMAGIYSLRGDHTIVIVAHRLSTVDGCDRIYRLVDGKLEGQSISRHLRDN